MIDIQGISPRDPLHDRVLAQLGEVLSPIRTGKVPAKVTFEDENGPKGGPDIRCTITVRLPRRAEIVVEDLAETPRLAFDGAFESLRRQVVQRRDERRDVARRPKKYYVAKRLLEGGPAGEAP
jgi:ribosome-associated translation inhibitor RaiA